MAKAKQLTVKHVNNIEKQLDKLHKATEDYLHAALEIAKLQGSHKVKAIRPHVLKAAKHMDALHKHRKKKKVKKKAKKKRK